MGMTKKPEESVAKLVSEYQWGPSWPEPEADAVMRLPWVALFGSHAFRATPLSVPLLCHGGVYEVLCGGALVVTLPVSKIVPAEADIVDLSKLVDKVSAKPQCLAEATYLWLKTGEQMYIPNGHVAFLTTVDQRCAVLFIPMHYPALQHKPSMAGFAKHLDQEKDNKPWKNFKENWERVYKQ